MRQQTFTFVAGAPTHQEAEELAMRWLREGRRVFLAAEGSGRPCWSVYASSERR